MTTNGQDIRWHYSCRHVDFQDASTSRPNRVIEHMHPRPRCNQSHSLSLASHLRTTPTTQLRTVYGAILVTSVKSKSWQSSMDGKYDLISMRGFSLIPCGRRSGSFAAALSSSNYRCCGHAFSFSPMLPHACCGCETCITRPYSTVPDTWGYQLSQY